MDALKVFIADDDKDILNILMMHIDKQEDMHVVRTATDGKSAYEYIKDILPDVCILDIMMSVWDGVETLYYKNGYILNSVKAWVVEGEWNESKVKADIARVIDFKKKPEPKEIVRNCQLILLDESTIEAGFPKVIEAAYDGQLTIDEYIVLIQNIAWARKFLFELPVDINMDNIESGVSICLHSIEESDEPDSRVSN